ncbi:histidine kinase [Modestobacter sp. VKM Ac-2986]|uniref:sensor histidine kinase n=1 Tax=Modestobacter sp. VKM Ac-2986 TaxID=3004140 RepID=UPI0022AB6930|nr:histidine kinase [Modestobacter sp. VKM Ac-2986]MCZ2830797.1 histidine kinase [Modestobacter sp. VKM Ac-2986]
MDRRRGQLLGEVGLPLVLAVATTGMLVHLRDGAPGAVELVVSVLLWVPALARRRAPLPAFAATALLVAAHWVPDGLDTVDLLPADVALWVALVAVAEHRHLRTALAATAVTELFVLASLLGDPLDVPVDGPPDGGYPIGLFTAVTVAAALFGRNRRTRQALLTQLRDRADRAERERDQQARIAVVEERSRIAREVHDVVSHNISVMTALADGAGYALATDAGRPQAREAVAAIADTGRSAIAEMHRLLGVFRTDASREPAPGLAELPALVEQVRAAGLPTTLTVTGRPAPLSATAQLAVYRLVQEALTNTRKHAADARHAEVDLSWDDEGLHVRVRDDGTTTTSPGEDGGQGLVGMRERFGAHGGTVRAGRGTGGWLVEALLPVPATVGAP